MCNRVLALGEAHVRLLVKREVFLARHLQLSWHRIVTVRTKSTGRTKNMKVLTQLLNDEQGASMAEYALLLALIAVATIGALQVLQGQIVGVFDRAGTAMNAALPAP